MLTFFLLVRLQRGYEGLRHRLRLDCSGLLLPCVTPFPKLKKTRGTDDFLSSPSLPPTPAEGGAKFALYDFFKLKLVEASGPNAIANRTAIYLGGAAFVFPLLIPPCLRLLTSHIPVASPSSSPTSSSPPSRPSAFGSSATVSTPRTFSPVSSGWRRKEGSRSSTLASSLSWPSRSLVRTLSSACRRRR